MAGLKQLKTWFFGITSEVRADGTTGGVRFRKTDKPTQQTFENLLQSTTFSTESSDKAKVSTGATIGSEQGLSVLANDTQAKANTTQLTDRSLVVQPHQLPTVENLNSASVEDMPLATLTIAPSGTTTRNQYQFKISFTWLTWLITRIFKSGGVLGDVPIKTNGTNYNWGWGNVGNDATTVSNIANNATFVSTLLANTTFVNNIVTVVITNNPTAITESLEVGFIRVHPITSIPSSKWLRCDGSAISRTTYADLFAFVGTIYGVGNGSTTFNIPDFRDKQITGYSGTKAIGSTSGSETHQISSANLPTHTHGNGSLATASAGAHTHTFTIHDDITSTTNQAGASGNNYPKADATTSSNGNHTHTITGATGDGSFANTLINHLDPYLATNIIIKVLA